MFLDFHFTHNSYYFSWICSLDFNLFHLSFFLPQFQVLLIFHLSSFSHFYFSPDFHYFLSPVFFLIFMFPYFHFLPLFHFSLLVFIFPHFVPVFHFSLLKFKFKFCFYPSLSVVFTIDLNCFKQRLPVFQLSIRFHNP